MRDCCVSLLDKEKRGWLYVRYEDFSIWPKPTKDEWLDSQVEELEKKNVWASDLLWMVSCSYSPALREKVRILVFGETDLFIFKLTGPVSSQTDKFSVSPISANKISEYFSKDETPSWQKSFIWDFYHRNKTRSRMSKAQLTEMLKDEAKVWEALSVGSGINYLPVSLEAQFPRDMLLPSVNSLAVYRYLNAGAFRPVSAIGPARNSDLQKDLFGGIDRICRLDNYGRSPAVRKDKNDKLTNDHLETWLGFMARQYLQWLMHGKRPQFANFLFGNSPNAQSLIQRALVLTLNPVQLEAAAANILTALGLVVDFYTANSLDAIDLRARFPKSWNQEKKDQVVTLLESSLELNVKAPVLTALKEKGVLSIQCKDYELDESSKNPEFIYFQPTAAMQVGSPNNLTTWSLIDIYDVRDKLKQNYPSGRWEIFTDWIEMLEGYFESEVKLDNSR